MDEVNVALFPLVIISDTTNAFLPADNKDLLELKFSQVESYWCFRSLLVAFLLA